MDKPQCMDRGQKTPFGNWFSPSTVGSRESKSGVNTSAWTKNKSLGVWKPNGGIPSLVTQNSAARPWPCLHLCQPSPTQDGLLICFLFSRENINPKERLKILHKPYEF